MPHVFEHQGEMYHIYYSDGGRSHSLHDDEGTCICDYIEISWDKRVMKAIVNAYIRGRKEGITYGIAKKQAEILKVLGVS